MLKIFKWLIAYFVVSIVLLLVPAFFISDIELLTDFYAKYRIFYSIIIAVLFIPLLIKEYKKIEFKEKRINNFLYVIIIGITLSVFYNGIVFYINRYVNFTDLYQKNNSLVFNLISSGIIGPIIEELLFRGIIYNKLKEKYNIMKSIIITTLLFSLLHFNLVQCLYGIILGFMLIYSYEKYKNIKAPIILHIVSNITSILFTILLLKDNFLINYLLIISSIILLIIIQNKIKYDIININKGDVL